MPLITGSADVFHKSGCYAKTVEALSSENSDVIFCATLVLSRLGHKVVHLDALRPLQRVLEGQNNSLEKAALAVRKIGNNEATNNAIEKLEQGVRHLGEHWNTDLIGLGLDSILKTLIKFGKSARTPQVLNTILNFISTHSGYIHLDNVVLSLKNLCSDCVDPIVNYVNEATQGEDENKLFLAIFIVAGISSQLQNSSSLELALRCKTNEPQFLGLLSWYTLIKINAVSEEELKNLTNLLIDSLHNESIITIVPIQEFTVALLEKLLIRSLNTEKIQILYNILQSDTHQKVTKEIAASVLKNLIVNGVIKENHFSESICARWKNALHSDNGVVQVCAMNVFKKHKTFLTDTEIEYLRSIVRSAPPSSYDRNSIVEESYVLLCNVVNRRGQEDLLDDLLEIISHSQGSLYSVADVLHEFDAALYTSDRIDRLLNAISHNSAIVRINDILKLLSKLALNQNHIIKIQHLLQNDNSSSSLRLVSLNLNLKITILAYLSNPGDYLEKIITFRVFFDSIAVIFSESRLLFFGANEEVIPSLSEDSLSLLREMFSRYMKRGNLPQMQLTSGYKITNWAVRGDGEGFEIHYSFDTQAAKVKLFPGSSRLSALATALDRLNNIFYLDLSENELDDLSVLLIIRHIVNHHHLTSLVMTRNLITEKGFGYFLEYLSENSNLKFIYFNDNRISFEKYYSVTRLEPAIQNVSFLDLSMNYVYPGKMLEEKIGVGRLDRKIVYRESRLHTLMSDKDRFYCKSLLTKPNSALLSQVCSTKSLLDSDYNIDSEWSVGAVIANRTQYFCSEHAFLVLEGVSDFGQRYIIMADLYSTNTSSDAIRIIVTYCSPSEYLNRIKHGASVYSRSFQISKQKEAVLINNIFDNRDQEKVANYQAVSVVNHVGYVNCIRWIKDRLTEVNIHLPTNWLGIPSLTVSHEQPSITCRIL